jgi:hypothetical protein
MSTGSEERPEPVPSPVLESTRAATTMSHRAGLQQAPVLGFDSPLLIMRRLKKLLRSADKSAHRASNRMNLTQAGACQEETSTRFAVPVSEQHGRSGRRNSGTLISALYK